MRIFAGVSIMNKKNARKGQGTNQEYRNLVGSGQQMQRLKEAELRKANRMSGEKSSNGVKNRTSTLLEHCLAKICQTSIMLGT